MAGAPRMPCPLHLLLNSTIGRHPPQPHNSPTFCAPRPARFPVPSSSAPNNNCNCSSMGCYASSTAVSRPLSLAPHVVAILTTTNTCVFSLPQPPRHVGCSHPRESSTTHTHHGISFTPSKSSSLQLTAHPQRPLSHLLTLKVAIIATTSTPMHVLFCTSSPSYCAP